MRFDEDELVRLLTTIRGDAPDPELAARLLARSEGNAFLAEELLAAGGAELPDTLRDAMMVRVERVSDGARAVLRVAACAGATRAPPPAGGDGGAVRSSSWRTDCARRSPTTSWCAAAAMRTRSATRCCARSCTRTSCPGERARLHAAIARALAGAPDLASEGAAVAAAELAHHWKAAHELGAALAASVDAGRAAARIAAFPEAQRHFDYALDVWDRVEDAEARAGMDRIDLTRRAADAAHLVADRERAIALARDAAARLDAARDPVRAGLVQERLARYLWVVGRDDEAAEALPRSGRDAPGRSAQRRTRARRRGRGPAADAPRAGTSGDTALRGGARRRPRGRRARRGGAGAQHARRVSLRPWRARRGRGLPARGARDRARAAAVARHRSCLREPGRLRRPGRPDRRGRTRWRSTASRPAGRSGSAPAIARCC